MIKIVPLILLVIGNILNAELSVERAAKIWIEQYDALRFDIEEKVYHPSELLDIIARHGHGLSDDIKTELALRGFSFSRDIVSTERPQNLDQYIDQGIFRFHYTTSGEDAVSFIDQSNNSIPDYVDSVLAVFDQISDIDFIELGYAYPPSDGWYTNQDNGGSDHYDVYLFNLSAGYYGYVMGENYAQADDIFNRGDNEHTSLTTETNALTSFMALRNDYNDFPGDVIDIIKVTSAHEFFHAIQFGYDGWEFGWVKEATAVWMEEVHYDDINDCHQFLNEFLLNPHQGFNYDTAQGYGSYIFFSYLTEHYVDNSFVKNYWINSINYDSWQQDYSIQTLDQTLNQYSLSLEHVMKNFHIANGILSSNSELGEFHYNEADEFPITTPNFLTQNSLSESDEEIVIQGTLNAFAADYYLIEIIDSSIADIGIGDCCVDILLETNYQTDTNVTVQLTTINNNQHISISDIFSQNSQSIERNDIDSLILVVSGFNFNYNITSDYGSVTYDNVDYSLTISVPSLTLDIKKDIIPRSFVLNQNFPNPFNGSTEISFSIPYQSQTQIKVFDIKGAYVGTILNKKLNAGKHFIHLDTEFINQNSLSSGTYFYQLNTTNNQRVRKFLYVK